MLPAALVPVASPYKAFADSLADAKAQPGRVAYGSAGPGSSVHMVTALFELMSGARLNHVPTVVEAGLPGYAASSGWTVAAPSSAPTALVDRILQDLKRVLATPAMQARFDAIGVRAVVNPPAEAEAFLASETVKWNRVIEAAKLQLD